jgi:hypothetical protein
VTFNPLSDPVDFVLIAGKRTPGIATIEGAESKRRLVIRMGYALSGGVVVYRGFELVKFKIKLRLFTQEDWDAWNTLKVLVDRPPVGVRAKALDVTHPILESQGVSQALVESVSQPERTEDSGEWTVTISMIEYRKPKPALSVPEGSQETPELTPEEIRIEELTAQAQSLTRRFG